MRIWSKSLLLYQRLMAVIRDESNYKAIEHDNERMTLVKEWRDTVHFISWYVPPVYVIRFLNYDGTVLQESELEAWETPVYTGETPTKPDDTEYKYIFDWWDSEIVVVDWNKDYTAQFEAEPIPVPVWNVFEFKDYWDLSKWTYITTTQQLENAWFTSNTQYQFFNWDITLLWEVTHIEWLIWVYNSATDKYGAIRLFKALTWQWETLKKLTLDFWIMLDMWTSNRNSYMDTYKATGVSGVTWIFWFDEIRWVYEYWKHRTYKDWYWAYIWSDNILKAPGMWYESKHQRRYQCIIDFENWTMTRRLWRDINSFHNETDNWWEVESVDVAIPDIAYFKQQMEENWLTLELLIPESWRALSSRGYVTAFQYISYVIE